ncbi:MAG: ABC transporter permease [Phycisphaerae bacterium]|nr:ABC transporter permease [Gemmatimonadaceae bacterium]
MIAQMWAKLRSLLLGMRHSSQLDAEMKEEFAMHVELRAADLVKNGMPESEALRQARREFGIAANHIEQGRESRGLRRFDQFRVSLLDFKLGFRMLLRYPGLTMVAGLALAFAICVGSATFELLNQVVNPTLGFANGGRIVAIQNLDVANNRVSHRVAYDLSRWGNLSTITNLGAYKASSRNLIVNYEGTPLELAEISASAFTMLGVSPQLGRTLIAADERADAPPVLVLGHETWRRVFNSDPNIVGRVVQFGRTASTIVGVMPEGFAFPVAQDVWTPLKLALQDFEPGGGPSIRVFAALGVGAELEDAQLELTNMGLQTSKDLPRTHEFLRPRVMPYTQSIINVQGTDAALVLSSNLFVIVLVGLICANVALLMFARAATRESEMAVRAALGASRGRIVSQLFIEAVVLGVLASLIGLAVSRYALQWSLNMVEAEIANDGPKLPFWIRGTLTLPTVAYSVGLTLLGAVIAGVLPALKVTKGLGARLKHSSAGAGGLRFGGVWTAVIIVQVAVTVTLPAASFFVKRDARKIQQQSVGFASGQFLAARLDFESATDEPTIADTTVVAAPAYPALRYQGLKLRLLTDPAVQGVTFATRLPRMYHPWNQVESDGAVAPRDTARGHRVARVSIDPDYFEVLGAPLLQGRAFTASDVATSARVAIVNRTFRDSVFGGRNPVGHRIRFVGSEARVKLTAADSAWIDIVGIAEDMGMVSGYGQAGVFEPIGAAGVLPVEMAIQARIQPTALAPRVRAIATLHDPDMRLHQLKPLDNVIDAELQFYAFWQRVILIVSAIALLLSLAAIYSVMSFAVSRRTREIGIRVALGSSIQAITLVIFRKPMFQVGWGIVFGTLLVTLLNAASTMQWPSLQQGLAILAYTIVMTMVCALACIVPARRALSVQPTEALRSEG